VVGRGGARRRAYREAQGEAPVPPAAVAARAGAPYVVPAGAVLVLVLSFGTAPIVSSLCTPLLTVAAACNSVRLEAIFPSISSPVQINFYYQSRGHQTDKK
jgi:hypothetical protein